MSKFRHAEMRRIGHRSPRGPSHILKPEGKRHVRPKAAREAKREVDADVAAWAGRRRAMAPACDPPCEECVREMEDEIV